VPYDNTLPYDEQMSSNENLPSLVNPQVADIQIGHFIIVKYNDTYYPGQVRQIREDELFVSYMNRILKK